MLIGAILTQDWSRVVQELARVTRPGGWVELLEISNTVLNAGPATGLLYQWLLDMGLSLGIDFSKTEEIGMRLTQAGLKQVTQHIIDIPLGAWDTQVGILLQRDFLTAYEAMKPLVCKQVSIDPAEFDRQLTMVLQEWKEQHVFQRFYLAYGQV
jgi:hypothetical protein